MKSFRLQFFLAGLLLAAAAPLGAMNNSDVIKMKQAGLTEETILLSIEKSPANYDTSAEALVALKQAGLSDAVIQKILAPQGSAATPAAPTPAQVSKFALMPLSSIAPPEVTPVIGSRYFLRYSMHIEEGNYPATNYARGEVVPINTPVVLLEIKNKTIMLKRTDNNQPITINNVEKYSKKTIEEIARGLLAAEQTPLEKLPEELAASIKAGEMRLGMTKELTLMARGFPPGHETPSLDGDRWVYWSSRFIKQTIVFENGRLVEGRGLN